MAIATAAVDYEEGDVDDEESDEDDEIRHDDEISLGLSDQDEESEHDDEEDVMEYRCRWSKISMMLEMIHERKNPAR